MNFFAPVYITDIAGMVNPFSEYMVIILFELIPIVLACILWLILRKRFDISKFYRIAIICCAVVLSLVIGYVGSSRMTGYEIMMDSLTKFNEHSISETGQEITLQEENEYKEYLSQNKDFQKLHATHSIKLFLPPNILMVFLALLFFKKARMKRIESRKTMVRIGKIISYIIGIFFMLVAISIFQIFWLLLWGSLGLLFIFMPELLSCWKNIINMKR